MEATGRVFVARLAGTPVFDPIGDRVGFVHDVMIRVRVKGHPLAVGLVVEVPGRRRVFLPITRVTSIAGGQVITTGLLNMRRFQQRSAELSVMTQIIDRSALLRETGRKVSVIDAAISPVSGREWCLTTLFVKPAGARADRGATMIDSGAVEGLYDSAALHTQAELLAELGGMRPADVADVLRDLPPVQQRALAAAMTDARLADVLEELDDEDGAELLSELDVERAADVLDEMQPDDAADLVGELPIDHAALLLDRMEPEEAEDVRRLLTYAENTAGGLMTTEPIILPPEATVAQALAAASRRDIPPALAAVVMVCRPPLETPTGQFLGAVHLQRALREPPTTRLGSILETDFEQVHPSDGIGKITRLLATYNMTAWPICDEGLLVGAVSVDDVLDDLLPEDWREGSDLSAGGAEGMNA